MALSIEVVSPLRVLLGAVVESGGRTCEGLKVFVGGGCGGSVKVALITTYVAFGRVTVVVGFSWWYTYPEVEIEPSERVVRKGWTQSQ